MARFFVSKAANRTRYSETVLRWLEKLDDNHLVLVEFAAGAPSPVNCDLLVVAPDKLVLIEFKDYTEPLYGPKGSDWEWLSETGAVKKKVANPIGQAKTISDTLSNFLRRAENLSAIFGRGHNIPPRRFKIFPFVVLPVRHPLSHIETLGDDFCWITQGEEEFFATFHSLSWNKEFPRQPLLLDSDSQAALIKLLDLEPAKTTELFRNTIMATPMVGWDNYYSTKAKKEVSAWVTVEFPNGEQKEHLLSKGVTHIGRSFFDAQTDIVVDWPAASRNHCYIEYRDGKYFLQDLNSRNGTYLDGVKVEPAQSRFLKNGAVITIPGINKEQGYLRITFQQNNT